MKLKLNNVNHEVRENFLNTQPALSTEEIRASELYWIQVTQVQHFFHEIEQITKGEEISKPLKIKALSPFKLKHPCILPANANFSEFTVKDTKTNKKYSCKQQWGGQAGQMIQKKLSTSSEEGSEYMHQVWWFQKSKITLIDEFV